MKELYTVVTGASQGLGKSFALELAKRNQNLILVSLPNENMESLCNELQNRFAIKAYSFETDLTDKGNVLKLGQWINDRFSVKMLINNAGLGGTKKFKDASVDYIDNIIQLNIMATCLLTRQLLHNLQEQDKGYILNISSLAAFSPIGYKTVYPASKAFIYSFSRGLNEELKDTNVFVSVVNPGPIKTNADQISRIKKLGFIAQLTSLDPDKVAIYCLNQLEKRDTAIVVSRFSGLFLKMIPIRFGIPMLSNKIKKELNAGL